jgi:hypothetical protein
VLKSKIVELYLHSPLCLHGIVFNYAQGQLYFFTSYEYFGFSSVTELKIVTEIYVTRQLGCFPLFWYDVACALKVHRYVNLGNKVSWHWSGWSRPLNIILVSSAMRTHSRYSTNVAIWILIYRCIAWLELCWPAQINNEPNIEHVLGIIQDVNQPSIFRMKCLINNIR